MSSASLVDALHQRKVSSHLVIYHSLSSSSSSSSQGSFTSSCSDIVLTRQSRFVAQSYGRPAVIQDIDVEVSFADMDDDSYTPMPVTSKEIFENGTQKFVTASSYHRYKARLYRIAAPITRVMRKARTVAEITNQIRTVHAQMLEFKRVLPMDLRLETYEESNLDYNKKGLRSILHLQSLALRISYDNIQMLLHRPLISIKDLEKQSTDTSSATLGRNGGSGGSGGSGGGGRGGVGGGQQSGDLSSEISEDMIAASRRQCWQSALQLSHLSRHRGALEFLKNTPLGAHIGMNCFTAGVMLAIFALSKPFTTQAQEAKQALGRLIRIGTWAQLSIASFNQSTGILKDLLRLIMEKELKALTEPNEHETFSSQSQQQQRRPIGEDVSRAGDNNSDAARVPTENSINPHHVEARVALIHHVDAVQQGIQPQPGAFGGGSGQQYASDPFGGFVDWYGSSANEGFDAALSSLQNGKFVSLCFVSSLSSLLPSHPVALHSSLFPSHSLSLSAHSHPSHPFPSIPSPLRGERRNKQQQKSHQATRTKAEKTPLVTLVFSSFFCWLPFLRKPETLRFPLLSHFPSPSFPPPSLHFLSTPSSPFCLGLPRSPHSAGTSPN